MGKLITLAPTLVSQLVGWPYEIFIRFVYGVLYNGCEYACIKMWLVLQKGEIVVKIIHRGILTLSQTQTLPDERFQLLLPPPMRSEDEGLMMSETGILKKYKEIARSSLQSTNCQHQPMTKRGRSKNCYKQRTKKILWVKSGKKREFLKKCTDFFATTWVTEEPVLIVSWQLF